MFESPPFHQLQEALTYASNPIGMRMRAAYYLRHAYENSIRNKTEDGSETYEESSNTQEKDEEKQSLEDLVVQALSNGLRNKDHGSLLRHEFAYVMGQLRDEKCCKVLEEVLLNDSDCIMVRHECGEALGAIGASRSIPVLKLAMDANPNTPEIGETCKLAIDFMEWKARGGEENDRENQPMVCACMLSPYSSVDPAPPHPQHANMSESEIGKLLRDPSLPLFERYRAMFSLRNKGGSESVMELGKGLLEDRSSALFRHEIAYVLGQMQHPDSVDALAESLSREDEHAMVRHESAEALGAIEGRWEEVETILKKFLNDRDVVVRESCVVALDAADYWGRKSLIDDEDTLDLIALSFATTKAQKV